MFVELALILVGLLVVWAILDNYFPSRKHPPGPFRLPILGNAIDLVSKLSKSKPPFVVFREMSRKYGPITYFKLGARPALVLNDFEMIKPLLNNDIWIDRPYNEVFGERSYGKPLGIIFVGGDGWKEMRRFSMRTLRDFGYGKQTSMQLTIDDEIAKLLEKVDKIASSPDGVLQMKYLFTMPVLNILWAMVSKTRTPEDEEKMKKLIHLVDDLAKAFPMGGNILDVFPKLRHVPKLTGMERVREIVKGIQEYFAEILDERRKEGVYKEESRDYIDVFMQEMDRHKEQNITPNHYTDEQFITTIQDLFEGGSETSSNTLEFAIYFAMKNPQVVKKVQEEIDRVVGRNRLPTTLDRPEMPYTEATLMEVQRMSNVLAITVRCPTEDTVLNGYEIEKGTVGIVNIYSIHMDEKFWGDPWSFRPERFLTENMEIDALKASHVLPFGAGKRVCLGEQMARTTLFTYFTALLQSYNFSEVPGDISNAVGKQGDPNPEATWFGKFVHVGFTLGPHPYQTKITKRQ